VTRTRRYDGPPKEHAVRFTRGNRRRKAWSRPSTRSMPSAKPAPPSSHPKSTKAGRCCRRFILDLLFDRPGIGIDNHDAARCRRGVQDRKIEFRAVHGKHHVEGVWIFATPQGIFDMCNLFPIARIGITRIENRAVVLTQIIHHTEEAAIGRKTNFTGIRQIVPCSSPNLHRFAVSGNPEAPPRFVDGRRGGRLLAEQRKILRFPSSKRTSPMVFSERMTNRTLHAVDVTGGGRSSVISRRMSANKVLGMATSAIWKAT
jgi:hypothetical protein